MLDAGPFLRTILDAPDDDPPRLVFADWLEENGETQRAEFIRVQCELAALPKLPDNCTRFHLENGYCKQCKPHKALRRRERELMGSHWHDWVGPALAIIPNGSMWTDHLTFCRGFAEWVTCPWADWSAHADAILKAHPVHSVRLTTTPIHDTSDESVFDSLKFAMFTPPHDRAIAPCRKRWPSVKTWELAETSRRGRIVTITPEMIYREVDFSRLGLP